MRILILILLLTAVGCSNPVKVSNPELEHVLSIRNCDSLLNDDVFKNNNEIKWPNEKPKDVVEAVLKLDSMTNEFNRHCFRICDPIEFYFGFGMGLRNEWVHEGTEELRSQYLTGGFDSQLI